MPRVMNGEDIQRAIHRISHEILETHDRVDKLVIVGIHTRGVHLARELAKTIGKFAERDVAVGELDVGPYRDDRHTRPNLESKLTEIPVDITARPVVLVDDVLYTGRTVRAALDALSEIGRPLAAELAVMVDRGHRELPIRADYVGKNIPTSSEEVVRVRLNEVDGEEGVWIEKVGNG